MEPLYVFLILNDVWIYILSALGLFWFINEYVRARRILRQAMFGLEREKGTRLRNNALAFIVGFTAVIGLVYFVNAQIRPTLSEELFKMPTPTPDIFSTRLASPTPLGTAEIALPSPTPPLIPTITLASQPGAAPPPLADETTPEADLAESPTPPGPTVTPFIGCTVDLNISEPGNGAFVTGAITFSGTADTEDFLHYRLEANGPETNGDWASLLGRVIDQPVRDGFLGNVNLSQWANGPYLIRLTAVNIAQSEVGQCVIQVTLNN
jgi:hypothetical protein